FSAVGVMHDELVVYLASCDVRGRESLCRPRRVRGVEVVDHQVEHAVVRAGWFTREEQEVRAAAQLEDRDLLFPSNRTQPDRIPDRGGPRDVAGGEDQGTDPNWRTLTHAGQSGIS